MKQVKIEALSTEEAIIKAFKDHDITVIKDLTK